jgi:hypothetical protein
VNHPTSDEHGRVTAPVHSSGAAVLFSPPSRACFTISVVELRASLEDDARVRVVVRHADLEPREPGRQQAIGDDAFLIEASGEVVCAGGGGADADHLGKERAARLVRIGRVGRGAPARNVPSACARRR